MGKINNKSNAFFVFHFILLATFLLTNLISYSLLISQKNNVSGQENADITIIINEIMPDPKGNDNFHEWIELYNTTNQEIILENWKIDDKPIPNFTFAPNSFVILAKNKTEFINLYKNVDAYKNMNLNELVYQVKMTLKNTGNNKIEITNQNGEIIDKITYGNSTEGISFERLGPLCTVLKKTNTQIEHTLLLPNSQVDEECLIPNPTITTTPTHSITNSPTISLTITPSPTEFEITITPSPTEEIIVTPSPTDTVTPSPIITNSPSITVTVTNTPQTTLSPTVSTSTNTITPTQTNIDLRTNQDYLIITEIFSSPSSGNPEWIEFYNTSNELYIDLSGMYIKDRSTTTNSYGNTKSYLPKQILPPNGYVVVENPKVSLNNKGDEIWLFNFVDQIIDNVKYGDTEYNISNIRIWDNDKYKMYYFSEEENEDGFLPQTTISTKGERNIYQPKVINQNNNQENSRITTNTRTRSQTSSTTTRNTRNSTNNTTTQNRSTATSDQKISKTNSTNSAKILGVTYEAEEQINIFNLENTTKVENNLSLSNSIVFLISGLFTLFISLLTSIENRRKLIAIFREFYPLDKTNKESKSYF